MKIKIDAEVAGVAYFAEEVKDLVAAGIRRISVSFYTCD